MTRKIIKYCALGVGSILFVLFLVLTIKSFSIYDDGWGKDISTNEDYIVGMVSSLVVALYGASVFSKKPVSELVDYVAGGLVGAVVSFYSLGTFFKAFNKAMNKHKTFDFAANQHYLYIGIGFLCILVVFVILGLKAYKKNSSKEN